MTPGTEPAAEAHEQVYCRTCRRALHRRTTAGVDTFIHGTDLRGGTADHPADPLPLSQIPDPVMDCDFCSQPGPAWVYLCADQQTDSRIITSRTVDARDYQRRHRAARSLSVETKDGPLQVWGERWAACDDCAAHIEQRDLYGLIRRVTDTMPAKYTRGTRLLRTRAALHATYSTLLATLQPGRGRITHDHPLGLWQQPHDDPFGASEPEATDGPDSDSAAKHQP
jgi:hypothetical protein